MKGDVAAECGNGKRAAGQVSEVGWGEGGKTLQERDVCSNVSKQASCCVGLNAN